MIKFPSIEMFKNVCRSVDDRATYVRTEEDGKVIHNYDAIRPTLRFIGTVKLHGCHADIVITEDNFHMQSRNNIISGDKDIGGFCPHMNAAGLPEFVEYVRKSVKESEGNINYPIVVGGEWCGGNIQKGVALALLDKMFIFYSISMGSEEHEDVNDTNRRH